MAGSKNALVAPILIMALGVGWLLTTRNIVPGVNWIWVVGLGATGVAVLVGSIDKMTVVIGPFLIAATVFSLLRQTGRISIDTEAPLLIIVLGALMLLAKILPIPLPAWLSEPPKPNR